MAAITAALVSLAPMLVEPILRSVEKLFGPKTGESKMEAAVAAIRPILEKMAAAGKFPGLPSAEEIRPIVEAIFQTNKSAIESPAATSSGGKFLHLPAGSKVTIELPRE